MALDLLNQALEALDELDESIAAAHLSGVIDIVAARIAEPATVNDGPARERIS